MVQNNKSDFDKLKSNIYDNQNNKDLKVIINKKAHDLKMQRVFG